MQSFSLQSKGKIVHFPANILALRTIHKYESTELEDDDDDDDDYDDDDDDTSEWSRDYPLTSEEAQGTPLDKEQSSPVQKKIRKATRRAKLENREISGGEWLAVLEVKEADNADDSTATA